MISDKLREKLQQAVRRMETILRTHSKYSNEYTRAVRDYQYMLHLTDAAAPKS